MSDANPTRSSAYWRFMLPPIYRFELMRQTRRGVGFWLRMLFPLYLLSLLYFFIGKEWIDTNLADQTNTFVNYYLLFESWVIWFLTPLLVCGTLIEDFRNRTFEWLLVTELSPREIIQGKVDACMGPILMFMTSGLPILALLQFLGGVDLKFVLFSTLDDLASFILLAYLSALFCVHYRSFHKAMMYSMIIFLLLVGVKKALVNFLVVPLANFPSMSIVLSCLFKLAWGISFLYLAGCRLEKVGIEWIQKPTSPPPEPEPEPLQPVPEPVVDAPVIDEEIRRKADSSERAIPVPRVKDYPVIWREIHFPTREKGVTTYALLGMLAAIPCVTTFWGVFEVGRGNGIYFTYAVVFIAPLLLACLSMSVAFHAAVSFSRERKYRRMLELLLLPISRKQLLLHKSIGSVLRFQIPFIMLIVLMVMHLTQNLVGTVLYSVFCLVQLAAWVSFAMMLSLLFGETSRARYLLVFIIGIWCLQWFNTVANWYHYSGFIGTPKQQLSIIDCCSVIIFHPIDNGLNLLLSMAKQPNYLPAYFLVMLFFLAVSVLCYTLSLAKLERETE